MVPLPMNSVRGAPTIERVLCALDVEQPILSAVSLASLIAKRFGASLEVLYAEGSGSSARFQRFQTNADRVQELMASHNAEQRLEKLVEGLKGSDSTTTRLVSGNPVASILGRSDVSSDDLIVLGARQRSDLGWQFRDDIARQVSAMANCATLTVHDRDTPDKIERILLAVNFDAVTTEVVAWAVAFAQRFDAEVHLLHVVSRERQTERTVDRSRNVVRSSSVPSEVSARLAELAQELTRLGVRATSDVAIASGVVNGITDCNDRGEFDLLIVGLSGPPQDPPRLTRGVVSTLRNRMSIPILSVRQATLDTPHSASGGGAR
jgi:nucleotide-binding universal stress UspA family protein